MKHVSHKNMVLINKAFILTSEFYILDGKVKSNRHKKWFTIALSVLQMLDSNKVIHIWKQRQPNWSLINQVR